MERKSGAERGMDNAAYKVKAGAKSMGKKLIDPDRDPETEYDVEKAKEKLG